ncbi:hypothetical protein SLEP1_g31754 [Rubroshorea leprosula]|uniref:Uncharacterized protein n=1 Tax=Rubroshorea leprosula TaxID=152421 RepID=A0AAV5KAA7_9ROSI|nr:hypothetical protein SLEP1_g31754 [Rubroshorea leprosula]
MEAGSAQSPVSGFGSLESGSMADSTEFRNEDYRCNLGRDGKSNLDRLKSNAVFAGKTQKKQHKNSWNRKKTEFEGHPDREIANWMWI